MNASNPVLVVYYSLTGNTARVARDLSARLSADVESVHDQDHGTGFLSRWSAAFDAWRRAPARIGALQRDPADYALTVVGTPVWSGQMTPAARAYLNQTAGRLQNVAFFITSGDTDISRIAPSLEAAAGRTAVASAGFNAKELAHVATYEARLAEFVERIARASRATRRVA